MNETEKLIAERFPLKKVHFFFDDGAGGMTDMVVEGHVIEPAQSHVGTLDLFIYELTPSEYQDSNIPAGTPQIQKNLRHAYTGVRQLRVTDVIPDFKVN